MKKLYSLFNTHNFRTKGLPSTELCSSTGFTLTELVVTVGIVSVIMAITLFSYSSFSDGLTVSSATQEISIATRQAQVYGLSVKEGVVGANSFTSGYGIYFSLDNSTNYYLFVDLNNNGKYDGGTELIQQVPLRNNVIISGICGATFGGAITCPVASSIRSMTIIFIRPNVDARIRFFDSSGNQYGTLYQKGRVDLRSFKGKTSSVTVENSGQIYVQ